MSINKRKELAEIAKIMNFLGVKVLRFKNEEVMNNLENVLEKIRSHFTENF